MSGRARCNLTEDVSRRNTTCVKFGRPENDDVNCNTCDGPCVYKFIELLFILSIIANMTVIQRVIKDKRLRKPTFVSIACLALSDAMLLTINYAKSIEVVIRSLSCTSPSSITSSPVYSTVIGIAWFSANGHILLLAVVRFILLKHPLKAHIYLTNRKTVLFSSLVWLFGIVLFVTLYLIGQNTDANPERSAEIALVIWICVYLLPLLTTAVLHCVKLLRVRRATKDNASAVTRTAIQRMSRMILFLICFAGILPLPRFTYIILLRVKHVWPSQDVKKHFRDLAILLFYLNNAVNPFVYAFLSYPFRRSIKSMFSSRRNTRMDQMRPTSMITNVNLSPESSPRVARQSLPP